MKRREHGFTLIEAAVAIAVVAILSGIIVPLVVKNLRDSQRARALNDIQVLSAAVASQLKDTGRRPQNAGGPNASTGAGNAIWGSGGANVTGIGVGGNNTFTNLFATTPAATGGAAQALFYGAAAANFTPNSEFAFKGPYLANDVAAKSSPWGSRYLIFGYNALGQTNNTPIWVVSAGADGAINTTNNPVATSVGLPQVWNTTGTSADDIAMRVN